MSDFEGVKRNAAQTFSNVVRSSSSSDKLDPQQMLLVMSALLEPLQEGMALDLSQLADYLKNDKRLSPNEIEELLVLFQSRQDKFFQSRQDKLGFQVLLPVSMHDIPDARRQQIIDKFNKAPMAATYSGTKDPPPGQPQRQETVFDKRKPVDKATTQRRKLPAASLFIIFGGAFGAYQIKSLPDPPQNVTLTSTADAFECDSITVMKTTAFCTIDRAKALKYNQAERERRREGTLANLRQQQMAVDRLELIDAKLGTAFR